MLWDLVYDFFVHFIFGGVDSIGVFYDGYLSPDAYTSDFVLSVGAGDENFLRLPFGNYFSLIATIITMVVILLFCIFIIKKIIGVMFRLFSFGV